MKWKLFLQCHFFYDLVKLIRAIAPGCEQIKPWYILSNAFSRNFAINFGLYHCLLLSNIIKLYKCICWLNIALCFKLQLYLRFNGIYLTFEMFDINIFNSVTFCMNLSQVRSLYISGYHLKGFTFSISGLALDQCAVHGFNLLLKIVSCMVTYNCYFLYHLVSGGENCLIDNHL